MHTVAVTRCLLLATLCIAATGCMSFVRGTARGYDLAPNGLARTDDAFRRALVTGGFNAAFGRARSAKAGAPDDALLRSLYRGLTGYYAGDYRESAAAFADAERLLEERVTKSATRSALSVVTSDRMLPYLPTRTERLMLRYYAMQMYLREGASPAQATLHNGVSDAALVEARKLSRDLAMLSTGALADGERALHATLRDAAGSVFEAAGEADDALVSYRNAAILRGGSRMAADSIRLAVVHGDSATVIVLLESGFAAHRVDRGITIALGNDVDSLGSPDLLGTDTAMVLTRRIERALDGLDDGGAWGVDRPLHVGRGGSSFLRVSWPALVREAPRAATIALVTRGNRGLDVGAGADVSSALAADFRRDRPTVVARAVARALAKGAVTEAVREKHGEWAGVLASIAGSSVERADTRSWTLLPARVTAVRMTVAAGTLDTHLRVGVPGFGDMLVPVPRATLARGETRVLSVRLWRSSADLAPPVVISADTQAVRARTDR